MQIFIIHSWFNPDKFISEHISVHDKNFNIIFLLKIQNSEKIQFKNYGLS